MNVEVLVCASLAVQGVLGGIDTLLNHDFLEQLARRREARAEVGLHSLREALWALLLGGLGWFAWHGAAALVIALLVLAEIAITAVDEFVENLVRVLPQSERVLHVFLTLNLGVLATLLVPVLLEWGARPTALVLVDRGVLSWILLGLGTAAAYWSVLDFIAWRRWDGPAERSRRGPLKIV